MKSLCIIDRPAKKFYSETHPFYRWKTDFKNSGLKVKIVTDHDISKVAGSDYLIIHSRYFENGWQNLQRRNVENEAVLMDYLLELRNYVGKIIWYDAADSTGSNDFPIIQLVDSFLKKQVLKDRTYYCSTRLDRRLRLWVEDDLKNHSFNTCPPDQLKKIKVGWNIGMNDYRYFGFKLSRLSNYVSYGFYANTFTPVDARRDLDLTFRGTVNNGTLNPVARQRNAVLRILNRLSFKMACGLPVPKKAYLEELRRSKVSVSPFGWGEVCYRDFETFLSGSLLIKPSMEHLDTYPNMYVPHQTYVPVSWGLDDLESTLDEVLTNYESKKKIAEQGQELYRQVTSDAEAFIAAVRQMIA